MATGMGLLSLGLGWFLEGRSLGKDFGETGEGESFSSGCGEGVGRVVM